MFFSNYDYRTTRQPPDTWYFHGAHFSRLQNNPFLPVKTAAVFNFTDSPKTFQLTETGFGLPKGEYTATNIWSFKSAALKDYEKILLPPHDSILLSVNKNDGSVQLLDADIKINRLISKNGLISLELAYGGNSGYLFPISQRRFFSKKAGR